MTKIREIEMKKFLAFFLTLVAVPVVAMAEGIFNPESPIIESPNLMEQYEQNKFAFAKQWNGKRVIVIGVTDNVSEGKLDGAFGKSPEYPYIMLGGLFRAYMTEPSGIDLANIYPKDIFVLACNSITAEKSGMYIQGICKPALQNRADAQNKINSIYLTKDPDIQKFVYSKESIQKLWPNAQ